jgi:cell division transport system ATP-binding protein
MVRFDAVGLRYDRPEGRPTDRQVARASSGAIVLHDLNLELPGGAFRWLLGPSGAGKTSLLRLLYLAVRPTSGRLTILDTEVTSARRRVLPQLRRRIGVVFQDFRLLPHLSAFDNVALPLRIAGRPEGQIRADVSELLRWVGLTGRLDARPAELSGGEQQRVAIARAVVARPALLLADEPTGNLDDQQAERLMHLFKELNRLGTTVVVATHNEPLVARHPAPVLRLEQGRLVKADLAW